MYYKPERGTPSAVHTSGAPDPVKRKETKAFRDPADVVTGTITMSNEFLISQCKRTEK